MEIAALKEEEIEAKGFIPVVTSNGTYYTHSIGDTSFVAIDDRSKHRDIWGYDNGKRMQQKEAKELVTRIFDKDTAKGETYTISLMKQKGWLNKRMKIAWNEIAPEFLQMQQEKAQDELLILSIQDDHVETANTKGTHYNVLREGNEVVACSCDAWYYKGNSMNPCKHMVRAQMAIGPEKLLEGEPKEETTVETAVEKTETITPVEIMNAEKGVLLTLSEKNSPQEVIEEAHIIAKALMDVVEAQQLYAIIKGKKFLRLEAWQTLGTLCKLSGMCTRVTYLEIDPVNGWDAQAIVVNNEGRIVSSGEAICMDDEENWKGKPMYQLKSMAQTRSLSKAYRMALSFIVVLAGYEPCPAEEMMGVLVEE